MTSVQRLCPQIVSMKIRGEKFCTFKQRVNPNPGEAAKSHFQAARPINADWIRILCMPVAPLRENFICEAIVSGQPVCLGQGNQMLVAVQFPRDLAVAYF